MRAGVVDRPADQLAARVVRGLDERAGGERVVEPDRLDAQARRVAADQRGQAGAHRRDAGCHERPGEPAAGPVAADLRQRPAAAQLGLELAERVDRADLHRRGHRALEQVALAQRGDDLVLAPGDLQVEVDLARRRAGGSSEGVERLVEGERRARGGRRPSRGRRASGPVPRAGPAGAVRHSAPSAKSDSGRRTSNSITSTPAPTAARKLSSVLPGTIASAPLWPTRMNESRRARVDSCR